MTHALFGDQPWYAVRCLFRTTENRPWGPTDLAAGENAYEERITLWRAASLDEAVERAESEARAYADAIEGDSTEYVGLAQAFHLIEEPADGAEVYSLIRVSELMPDDYLDRFFDTGRERQRIDRRSDE
jgi:hypothetical protein